MKKNTDNAVKIKKERRRKNRKKLIIR